MEKQIIITVAREFGSGGHSIAQGLADRLEIPLYDKEMFFDMPTLEERGYDPQAVKRYINSYDEKPVNKLLSRRVGDYSNSLEENLAHKIFKFIRKKADEGESFVVVGRCAEYLLRKNPNALRIFVRAEKADKAKRISELYNVSERKAVEMMKKVDAKRKLYHNYYSDIKWGDTRGYDVCINSSYFGVDKAVDAIMNIIELKKI